MAVHTKLSQANIEKILTNYNLGDLLNFNGIKEGIENTNYLLETKHNKFIITIFEKRVDTSLIPFYFEVMTKSKSQGIECPVPIENKNGEYVNIIKGKKMAVFIFLEGKSKKKWSELDCFKVGKKLAEFHSANANNRLNTINNFAVNYWNIIFKKCKNQIDNLIPNSFDIVTNEIDFISNNWPKNLPSGVIHADLFPDNVFFKNGKISGFLDFYFSCNDFLSYDLAITINAWCFVNKKFNKKFFLKMISGYESIRRLKFMEKKNINLLLRGAALRFFLTRFFDSLNNAENKMLIKKDPSEFLEILNFHINNDSHSFYFNE